MIKGMIKIVKLLPNLKDGIQDLLGFKNLKGLMHNLSRMILHVILNLMTVTQAYGSEITE